MTRKPFKIETRLAVWKNADGTETDVVRLFGGTRSLAVDYTEIPALIAQLEKLQQDHEINEFVNRLVIDE